MSVPIYSGNLSIEEWRTIEEFPGNSVSINTAIRSFKSQLKELEKK